jgi:hypothetical protein
VPQDVRDDIIRQAVEFKHQGYPMMNSVAGMKLLRDPKQFYQKRQCWVSNFMLADGTNLPTCPGEQAGVCADCGFGMGAEMTLLWNLHPSMIKAGLSVRGK